MKLGKGTHYLPAHWSDKMFSAFQQPGFRWLWLSATTSFMSRIIYGMAEGWLVLTITNSPFWVGAMAGIRGAAIVFLSPFAGVLVDRVNRRHLLLSTQVMSALITLTLAYLTISNQIHLWQISLLSLLQGISMTLNIPARFTLTMDVVGKRNLLNASATTQMGNSLVQIVGPTMAGIVISKANVGAVYVLTTIGFIIAALALLKMGYVPKGEAKHGSPVGELKEGVKFVFLNPNLRALFLLGLVVEAFGWSSQTMLPVMARDLLKGGATGFGLLNAAAGIGALAGTMVVANLSEIKVIGRMMLVTSIGFGGFLILFAFSPWFPLSMFLLAVAVGMGLSFDSMLGTTFQILSPDNMRGRVMSFYALTFGMTTMGGFGSGIIANVLTTPIALGIAGSMLMLNSLRVTKLLLRLKQ